MTHTNLIKSEAQRVRIYDKMRGISPEASDIDPTKKLLYAENMYVPPQSEDGAIESVPGFRILRSFPAPIRGIYTQKLGTGTRYMLIHAKDQLYRFDMDKYNAIGNPEPIATLADRKSHAFSFGRSIYILDGEKIVAVNEAGAAYDITLEGSCYIPTTYRDGKEAEDRNLLSDKFRETTTVRYADEITYGTADLIYTVTDEENMECGVSGISTTQTADVYVPSYTVIDGRRYAVTAILESAFWNNTSITGIYISGGIKSIGQWAFWGAKNMTRVVLSPTVETIGDRAFYSCSSLSELYLGIGLKEIGVAAFSACSSLTEVNYAGGSESFNEIVSIDVLGSKTVNYNTRWDPISVAIPVYTQADSIISVQVNGVSKSFTFDRLLSEIRINFQNRSEINGKTVTVLGSFGSTDTRGFLSTSVGSRISAYEAVVGCTVCQTFDGRIFLSGNPDLAGTVFYSQLTEDGIVRPDYFGNTSYFIDGQSDHAVTSLIASEGDLAVFKSEDDGSGSIFYHTPGYEGGTRVYPLSYTHGGIRVLSEAHSFFDDTVFVSDIGLTKLRRINSDQRQASCLTEEIMPLINTDGDFSLTAWQSFLVIACGDSLFLGDARRRLTENKKGYEWYLIKGVGTYKNSTRVYRYAETAPEGYYVSSKAGEVAEGEVLSVGDLGTLIYYIESGAKRIAVHPTEEYTGGSFYSQCVVHGDGELLFFGTECGDLCIFNNDMYGVPPERISGASDFDPDEYRTTMGKRLHPEFYSFAGHAPKYVMLTAEDDCDIPYLEKSTVPRSLVVRIKNIGYGGITCSVKTEKGVRVLGELASSEVSFADLDASLMTYATDRSSTVSIDDRSRGWIRKQICLSSDRYCSPFGVYSLSYRYKIKGAIKNSTG